MGEEDTKVVTVEPTANGTSSLEKTPDAICGKEVQENASGKEAQKTKKVEDTGPEKMEIDDEVKQDEGKSETEDKESEVAEKEKEVETEKMEEKDVKEDKEQAETAKVDEDKGQPEADKMDEDTADKSLKADDSVSAGATEEDTVMKENVESDDRKDMKGAENQEMNKIDTTEGDQEKTEKESQEGKLEGGKVNGKEEGIKEDIKEEENLVGGDKGEDVDEAEKVGNVEETNEQEALKEKEGELAEEEEKEADTEVDEPKVEDKKTESDDDKEDRKEDKPIKRAKRKAGKARGKTKSDVEKKEIEPKTPFSDRPVRERKSVERLVAVVDKDSSKEFHVEKVC